MIIAGKSVYECIQNIKTYFLRTIRVREIITLHNYMSYL